MNASHKETCHRLGKGLIWILVLWVILEELLCGMFGFPAKIRYLNDVFLACMIIPAILILKNPSAQRWSVGERSLFAAIVLFVLFSIVDGLAGRVPILRILWAGRNLWRFLLFAVLVSIIMSWEDLSKLLEFLFQLQWINLALAVFQFFVLGKKQDYLGGLFGVKVGCNTYTNVYFCFLTAYVIIQYFEGKKSLPILWLTLTSLLAYSGAAEIKLVFFEVILFAGAACVFFRGHHKKILHVILAVFGATVVGLWVLKILYPSHFYVMFHPGAMVDYDDASDMGYVLSRLHPLRDINRQWFHGDLRLNLFGYGFGACEYASFDFLTSDFYREFGYFHYRWFANQMMFLETGYLGLILYHVIFLVLFINSIVHVRRYRDFASVFTVLMCMATVLNLWYNATVRMEAGYLLFVLLPADVLARRKSEKKEENTL